MKTSSIQIWNEHSDRIKAFICNKMDNNQSFREDIIHDVLLKITEKEDRVKRLKQPASYMLKMAQNTIIDYYRAQKRNL